MYSSKFLTCVNFVRKTYSNVTAHSNQVNLLCNLDSCCISFCQAKQYCYNSKYEEMAYARLEKLQEDPEKAKLLRVIQLEIDVMRCSGEDVPVNMRPQDWESLLECSSKSQRLKYIRYRLITEKKRRDSEQKKMAARIEREKASTEEEDDDSDKMKYNLSNNTLFLRIRQSTIWHQNNWNMHLAHLFGSKIVYDCGYEEYMKQAEITNTAKQLCLAYGSNRAHNTPFDMYFCNLKESGHLAMQLERIVPSLWRPDFPVYISSESYKKMFNKNDLIYLSPHSPEVMTSFEPNKIYIIGAWVDKSCNDPISYLKAKQEGLRTMKFPLDLYLKWGAGSHKSLTIDQTLNVLLELKSTRDWTKAFRYVPTRKLKSPALVMLEKTKYKV